MVNLPCALYILSAFPVLSLAAATGPFLDSRAPPSCVTSTKNPPPAGYVCNQQGTAQNLAEITSGTAATQVVCRDRCLNNPTACISFAYGPGKHCETYSKKITQSQFKKGPTGKTFWNRNCYSKTCTCPSDQRSCDGDCVNLSSDPFHCGTCGTICEDGKTCSSGQCSCPSGDLGDDNNCGTCGQACDQVSSCQSGTCQQVPYILHISGTDDDSRTCSSLNLAGDGRYYAVFTDGDNPNRYHIDGDTGYLRDDAARYAYRRKDGTGPGYVTFLDSNADPRGDIMTCSLDQTEFFLSCSATTSFGVIMNNLTIRNGDTLFIDRAYEDDPDVTIYANKN